MNAMAGHRGDATENLHPLGSGLTILSEQNSAEGLSQTDGGARDSQAARTPPPGTSQRMMPNRPFSQRCLVRRTKHFPH